MSEERQDVIVEDAAAPRWIGVVFVVLAVISLGALGVGWSATNRAKALEQNFSLQLQQSRQSNEVLGQRLAKAEDTNAQLQGELSVVTDKVKLTESEINRARAQAKKIKDEDTKQLADLENNVSGQLATKANLESVNKIGTDVDGVKTDLESTKANLNLARGEFGTLIAKNHDEVEELKSGRSDGRASRREHEEEPL
jgi:chromosome segregation ATPase